jgi:hypothetical protein
MFKQFYHGLMRKYVTVFGTMFNNIAISRFNQDGTVAERIKVPLTYSPRERMLERIKADPKLDRPIAINLPTMGFEIVGLNYAPERKLSTIGEVFNQNSSNGRVNTLYNPVPYDIQFRLTIYTNRSEDANQIVEQILPYFTPEWTNTLRLVDDPPIEKDIPVNLVSVANEDTYEGSLQDERRNIVWTLDFTMQAYFYGPAKQKQLIRFVDVRVSPSLETPMAERDTITVQPGMTANGEPTTDITLTIPYSQIDSDDQWDYIIRTEYNNGS